jgi:hypothetical protein
MTVLLMVAQDTPEGKQAAQILVVHIESCVVCDVWREDGAIAAVQSVALLRLPVQQMCLSIELVYQTELSDIMASSEHCHNVCRCAIFLQINKQCKIAQMVNKVSN